MGSIHSDGKKPVSADENGSTDQTANQPAEVIDDSAFTETTINEALVRPTDNVGEGSVEIDVESLIADFEAEAADGVDASGRVRRRLDAIMERKRRHEALVDFEDYDTES
jgi:hypothetical protein